ncbi:MAG: DUF3108 domain-containing protein [Thermoanaerobaculia bacterium]|nr:DUF3108 domain-containing protein [Thermoanaerobaculia bacterium]MBP9823240.1 DUF3108 domain-containing protein [Thermoanaerobaculia bacterium]
MTRARPHLAGRRTLPARLRLAVLVLLLAPTAVLRADETLHYRWKIEGFFGALAGLFFPSHGDARLSQSTLASGNLQSSLLITSDEVKDASYFTYEAEIEPATGRTVTARSSQLWQGKQKDKSSPPLEAGTVDVASAIHLLRRTLPTTSQEMEIWSDGKLYPVQVQPAGTETRKVGGKSVETLHYTIRPLVRPERRVWKGELDLWFARDPQATPVEMLVARSPARLRLALVQKP